MQTWIISANGYIYDHAAAFEEQGYIDWRQRAKYSVGDIVYIYCTKPFQKIMYKTEVRAINMPFDQCTDDKVFWKNIEEYNRSKEGEYARLELLEQADNDYLSLPKLKEHGLNAAPQGPVRASEQLANYIDLYLNDYVELGIFPEDLPNDCIEGIKTKVTVNKYEKDIRSVLSFIPYAEITFISAKTGQDIGKKFIHVHHIIPISTIGKEYRIDYENHLVPVCPNCHAMLHHGVNGQVLTIDQLKDKILDNIRDGSPRED